MNVLNLSAVKNLSKLKNTSIIFHKKCGQYTALDQFGNVLNEKICCKMIKTYISIINFSFNNRVKKKITLLNF